MEQVVVTLDNLTTGISDADELLEMAVAEDDSGTVDEVVSDLDSFEQKLADNGATIVSLTDEELAVTAAHVRAQVWPQVLEEVGQDWGQSILDQIGE